MKRLDFQSGLNRRNRIGSLERRQVVTLVGKGKKSAPKGDSIKTLAVV
jgi:hypothetical protein